MADFGLLGRHLNHSFSAEFFNSKFEKEKLPHLYRNFDLPDLSQVRDMISRHKLKGLNVTIPYKTEIIEQLDEIDKTAAEIGAVNTIKVKTTGLKGFNTDAFGFKKSLSEHLSSGHKRALVLGTGGASKAVQYVLKTLEIEYLLVSRNPEIDQISYSQMTIDTVKNRPLIINCTPLGTFPNVKTYPDIPYAGATRGHLFFDLVYNPRETAFLNLGNEHGAKTVNGLDMLIYQAEKAWEIWTT
jgi:shikimate dehydrogenase